MVRPSDRSIRVLNDQAALIETTWTRLGQRDEVIERLRVMYLTVRTGVGWQFISVVESEQA